MQYPGGKGSAGVAQMLISLMPPHDVYIEPFLGGGAVMRLKRPARLNIGIDLDQQVIDQAQSWEALTVSSDDATRSAGALASQSDTGLGLTRLLAPLARPGEASSSGDALSSRLALPGDAPSRFLPLDSGQPRASMVSPGDVSSSFQFLCTDAMHYLSSYPFTGNELVYCDPPYMPRTRVRQQYTFEMTDSQHKTLLAILNRLPCMVMLSGYWTPLYHKVLEDWLPRSYPAMTRAGRQVIEYVWINYPLPARLHDYRFLGQGFRQRERLKRLTARWVKRLTAMPLLEQQALMSALEATQETRHDS